jgi:hypothetical protein
VRRVGLAALVVAALVAGPAAAAERYVTMKGAAGAGPAEYDRVWVQKLGPARARRVLVLVPGTLGGAGTITPVAREIVTRVRGLAVWIVDRRQQAFEDTSVFERHDRRAALDYYAGLRYRSVKGEDAKFVSEWGLRLQLEDLRRVVRRAAGGGRRVILGGHSAGASTAVAYAAWDFAGMPGHRELDGLVLIDGGLLGSFDEASARRARRELADIKAGRVFLDVLGFDIPEIAGIFPQLGAVYAYQRPNQRSVLQQVPLVPDPLKPPFPATNEAQLGYVFDETTSPDEFASFQVRAGRLARSGEPRPWRDGELTPIRRFARAWAANRPNALEWYYPRRLLLDIDAASDLRMNAAARFLGLRLLHGPEVDLPLYAYSTVLTRGRVARGARRLARMSRIEDATVIDNRRVAHLDPLTAAPRRNEFLRTVVPFLRRLAG